MTSDILIESHVQMFEKQCRRCCYNDDDNGDFASPTAFLRQSLQSAPTNVFLYI